MAAEAFSIKLAFMAFEDYLVFFYSNLFFCLITSKNTYFGFKKVALVLDLTAKIYTKYPDVLPRQFFLKPTRYLKSIGVLEHFNCYCNFNIQLPRCIQASFRASMFAVP